MSRALLSDLSGLLLFVRTDMMPRRRGSKKGLPVVETSMPMKDALRILVLEDDDNDVELIRRCLSELSPEHAEIIDLVYYQEKSIKEIVEILGIPENTVKTRMFYARKRLAVLMTAQGVDRAA